MKIALTVLGDTPESQLDQRFGRAEAFLVADTETKVFTPVKNVSKDLSGGAGIVSAQQLNDLGVAAVITGNVGPNAMNTLKAAGIKIYRGKPASAKTNLEQYLAGGLQEIRESGPSHAGMRNRGGQR
ncbi:MAG TPA: dinitrogenase iron-molybdenum cofactor biosynthesis protein [Clostridiales bacterium]|nr:dinitrogenase iron-molybdenum cofactor biosynthesis protein [Clostridiales bacterium]